MNLEFVWYDHYALHLIRMQEERKRIESEEIHIPHHKPMEDDGAHCEDENDD